MPLPIVVLALPIDDWSIEVADDGPEDGPDDVTGPAWAGLVPVSRTSGTPVSAPDLRPGIEAAQSVRRLPSRVTWPLADLPLS